MLIGIGIENFKGLKKCEILNLGKVNVFVGRNNSGKSSILDALCLIRTAFNYYLHDEPLPTVLLRRKAIERSAYVTRNFWYNYDTSQKIKFNLEFRDEGKLNIETSWTGDTRLLMLFEDPSNKLNKIDEKYFSRVEIDITAGFVNFAGGFDGFSSIFPNFFNFLRNIVLIDDYLARKLEKLEKSVFRGILEPRLDKKVVEELNEIYDVGVEGLTYIPISPNIDRYRLALPTPNVSLHIDELGDGAKYATAILSLCLLIRDTAFLIEEIESHQHVGAITKLIPELIKLANMRNIQLFLTTHSVEVMETLSRLPEEYDIHFFHVENKKGDIEVRHLGKNINVKLLLDLGVDIRYIDTTKKFIVVEGEDDTQFLKSLLNRYGRDVEELGYLVTAGNKDIIKHVLTALLSTKKEIVVVMDYDKQEKKTLIQSLGNAVESRNYKIISQNDNAMEIEGNIRVNLLPMGLYNDEMLKQIGIKQFEMEDYCLKLIGIDENLREWAGVTLDELVEIGKRANIDGMNLHKSSTLLKLLAIKKNMAYRDLINHIISNASDQALEITITGELKEFLYKEIGR